MRTPRSRFLTRRRLLLAAPPAVAVAALSACTDPAPTPVDPDRVALESALDAESLLLAAASSWTFSSTELSSQARAVLEQHVDVLLDALGDTSATVSPTTSATPSPSPAVSSTTELVRLIDSTADAHTRALRSADASLGPLLASLAASDATLAAAVRREES